MSQINPIESILRSNPIAGISPIDSITKNSGGVQGISGKGSGTSFADVINSAITKVNNLQIESSQTTDDFISGKSDNIHSVIIAGSKADLALQMTLQVRNKVMDAYNEIMRMNI